jgi:hypothetical protein
MPAQVRVRVLRIGKRARRDETGRDRLVAVESKLSSVWLYEFLNVHGDECQACRNARSDVYRDRGLKPILSWRFRHTFHASLQAFPGINKLMRTHFGGDGLGCLLS